MEASRVGEARRAVTALAGRLGFSEAECGKAALVVTETASNLVKHAREGILVLTPLERGRAVGIEVLALDKGPGMGEMARCLRDGFSTAGTPGTGLGAILRLSAFTDIYSHPATGTALLARLWSGRSPPPSGKLPLDAGAVSVPKAGEEVCGDAWGVEQTRGRGLLLVADGLGHGPLAAEASRTAVRVFRANARSAPAEILRALHGALQSTRGAAIAVAEVDLDAELVRYAGVGNIAGAVLSPGVSRSMVSHNGTVGHGARKFQEFTYPFPAGATLVLHSDGLASRWGLDRYPGLLGQDPSLVAGVLYRDFQRGRDDITVLVARAAGRGDRGAGA
jgi:anti-sigma regulatory factor (Ser/Thr protein kinase)